MLYGELHLTNFKLSFKPNGIKDALRFEVFYGQIAKVERSDTTVSVICKDERFLRFKIENYQHHKEVSHFILKYALQKKVENLFASQSQEPGVISWKAM